MKVLLVTYELLMPGGTETSCITMAEELIRLGHEPIIYTPKPGTYAALIRQRFSIQPHLDEIGKIKFDMAIIQFRKYHPPEENHDYFKVWISNDKTDFDKPATAIHRHVAISEEVVKAAKAHGFHPVVVRNGINCERFVPRTPLRKKLTKVALITHHFPGVVNIIKAACQCSNIEFIHVGHPKWELNIEDYINSVDLVISLGRGIYEAMACGRNCIVYDYNGADGFVTPDTLPNMQWYNCSGRLAQQEWTPEQLAEEFLKYDPKLGSELRQIALHEYNIRNVIENHLQAYHEHTLPTV